MCGTLRIRNQIASILNLMQLAKGGREGVGRWLEVREMRAELLKEKSARNEGGKGKCRQVKKRRKGC